MSVDYRVEIESALGIEDLMALTGSVEISRVDVEATGDFYYHVQLADDTLVSAHLNGPSLLRPPLRFGMTPGAFFVGYPLQYDDYRVAVLSMAEATSNIIVATECRGYSIYIEPVHFYWDRNVVIVNQDSLEPEATAELFRKRGLSVSIHPLDIDVGWPVVG